MHTAQELSDAVERLNLMEEIAANSTQAQNGCHSSRYLGSMQGWSMYCRFASESAKYIVLQGGGQPMMLSAVKSVSDIRRGVMSETCSDIHHERFVEALRRADLLGYTEKPA